MGRPHGSTAYCRKASSVKNTPGGGSSTTGLRHREGMLNRMYMAL